MGMSILRLCVAVGFLLGVGQTQTFPSQKDAGSHRGPASTERARINLTLLDTVSPWTRLKKERHPGVSSPSVSVIAESPNQQLVAWGDGQGNVFLWSRLRKSVRVLKDVTLGKAPTLKEETGLHGVLDMRFRDDQTVVGLSGQLEVSAWRVSLGQGKPTLDEMASANDVAFSAVLVDGSFVQCVAYKGGVLAHLLWVGCVLEKYSTKTGRYQETCRIYPQKRGQHHEVETMAVSPDCKLVAIGSECNAGVVSVAPFKLVRSLGVDCGRGLAFSPDGSRLAVSTIRGEVFVFSVADGQLVKQFTVSSSSASIDAVAFVSNDVLVVGHSVGVFWLNVLTGQTSLAADMGGAPKALLVSRDGRRLYAGCYGSILKVLELP